MTTIRKTATELGAEHHRYCFGQFILDVDRGTLLKGDLDIPLRPKCFEVLKYLIEHQGLLVTKDELMKAVWPNLVVTEGSLTQCLIKIRQALGDTRKEVIRTIPRRGFLFDVPVTVHQPEKPSGASVSHDALMENRRPSRWSVVAAVILASAIVATWWQVESNGERAVTFATVLKEKILGGQYVKNIHVGDTKAKNYYLRAKFYYDRRAFGDAALATEYFQRAVNIDPGLVDAWIGLAGSIHLQITKKLIDEVGGMVSMKSALDKAVLLAPDSPELHIRLFNFYRGINDLEKSQIHFERALQLGQNSALVLSVAAGVALSEGDIDDALDYQRRAASLDPVGFTNHQNLAYFLYMGGQYEEAIQEWKYASTLSVEHADNLNWLIGLSWVLLREYDKAWQVFKALPDGDWKNQGTALVHYIRNEPDLASAAVQKLQAAGSMDSLISLAEIAAFCGNIESSYLWLNLATIMLIEDRRQGRFSNKFNMMRHSPFLKMLDVDGRWEEWVSDTARKIKLVDSEENWQASTFELAFQRETQSPN